MEGILTAMQTILTAILAAMSNITTWIIGDDLAMLFFGMMLILFAVKLVLTLVHNS